MIAAEGLSITIQTPPGIDLGKTMCDQSKTPPVKTPADVKAELLEHLKSELRTAKDNMEKNEREGFPDASASWLPSVAKWQRMISYVEKAS